MAPPALQEEIQRANLRDFPPLFVLMWFVMGWLAPIADVVSAPLPARLLLFFIRSYPLAPVSPLKSAPASPPVVGVLDEVRHRDPGNGTVVRF